MEGISNMKKFIGVFAVLVLSSVAAFAEDTASVTDHAKHHAGGMKDKMAAEPSPEMRAKMAEMHQLMADCLKSTKTMAECRQDMKKNCPMMKEGGHCPMMDEMDGMKKGHPRDEKHE
jgi:hypothetical protein